MPTYRVVFEVDALIEAEAVEETDKELIFLDAGGNIVERYWKDTVRAHWPDTIWGEKEGN